MLVILTAALAFIKGLPWQAWAFIALAIAFVLVYHQGDVNGAGRVQDQWNTAQAQALALAKQTGDRSQCPRSSIRSAAHRGTAHG